MLLTDLFEGEEATVFQLPAQPATAPEVKPQGGFFMPSPTFAHSSPERTKDYSNISGRTQPAALVSPH